MKIIRYGLVLGLLYAGGSIAAAADMATEHDPLPFSPAAESGAAEPSDDYLIEHYEMLESQLLRRVLTGNTQGLAKYVALYQQVPNRDGSLIDWGNAILAAEAGDATKSIALYRKINSVLPELMPVRFQLAMALFHDRQYQAAQNEFEKLRSGDALPEEYSSVIESYLDAIAKQNEWDFSLSGSYLYDENLNNAPPIGTKLTLPNGAEVTSEKAPEKGSGLKFSIGAEKRKSISGNWFTALHLDTYGTLYWGSARKYNDLTGKVGVGFGYADALTEVELIPFYAHRWFVPKDGGADGEQEYGLNSYNNSWGLRLDASRWLSPKFKYQGSLEWSHAKHRADYANLNGNDYLFSNTLLYMRSPQQYWYSGINYARRDIKLGSNAYHRIGANIGWGQEWGHGISTRLNLAYAQKTYDDIDFLSIKKKNHEFDAGLSIWNRNWHYWGITPRLSLDYHKVNSNHPFYGYDNTNVYLDFSKLF